MVSHVKPKTHSNHHDLAEMGGNHVVANSHLEVWVWPNEEGFPKMGEPKASKISLLQGKPMVLGHPKFENHAYSEKTYIQ